MIDREHDLPITQQAKVPSLSRSTVHYQPRPLPDADLKIMRRLDDLHLEFPFAGARMLRGRVRRSLYAAALPAAFKWNPALIALYKRLIKDGKEHKRALIACARKLLIYANTVLARDTPWVPKTAGQI